MPTPRIPLDVLFGNPERAAPKLSPDGSRLAYLAPDEGVLNVWVESPAGGEARAITRDRERGIRTYFWTADGGSVVYLQDRGGDENWRLYRTRVADGDTSELTPFENTQAQVIEYNKHHPDDLLLGLNREDERFHDVYRLTLSTGALELVAKNTGTIVDWVATPDLEIHGAVAARPDGGFDLLLRDDGAGPWQTALTWSADENLNSGPLGFSRDGRRVFLLDSRASNAARLLERDVASGTERVLAEDPTFDVSSVMVHPDTYEVQAVGFLRARLEWTVLDDRITEEFEAIRQMEDGDFSVYDRTAADDQWLVGFTRDRGPGAYYRWDRATARGTLLCHDRPRLLDYTLAPMEPVAVPARDGLTLHGYLTLPPGRGTRDLPLVLNVHGGPWARDAWGYDPEAQWLANRGYACLQINYRGSTGYGKAFINAGDHEWGGKMHDDLVDTVRWAVDRGTADPARVAIYGGSYGGYAALVGATFTPGLFCCAVDIVGPSNLITFLRSIPPYWSTYLEVLRRRVGDPDTEADFLTSRSPLSRVDHIRVPLLIAQGANDPRVKQAESEQIVAAMAAKGIDHEYLLFPDEGHGFAKPDNRLKFYRAAERFLAKHLGGADGPAASKE